MDKVDFKRSLPGFRAKQGRFDLIEVPDSQYLMINGHGDPNTLPISIGADQPLSARLWIEVLQQARTRRDYAVPPPERAVVGR